MPLRTLYQLPTGQSLLAHVDVASGTNLIENGDYELDILGSRNALRPDFEAVAAMLADGAFPREGLVSRVVPLEEAGAALAEWSADPGGVTKIHVDVGGVL